MSDDQLDLKRSVRRLLPIPSIDRLPPHDAENEAGLLGCVLLQPDECMTRLVGELGVKPEAFYDLRNGEIFKAMLELYEKRVPVDLLTLSNHFNSKQLLEQIGGLGYLMVLPDAVPSAANLSAYVQVVKEKHLLRKIIQTCTHAVSEVYENGKDPHLLLDTVERDILAIRDTNRSGKLVEVKELVSESIAQIEKLWEQKGAITGLSTGFVDLDRYTDGLHAGELTVLSGFPSTGKTSLSVQIAEQVAVEQKRPVGVFSLEMNNVSLITRCICSRARVNLRKVRDGFLVERDFPKLTSASGKIAGATMFIDDASDLSVDEIRARARRYNQQAPVALWVIDYLQLVKGKGDNREQEVASVALGAKYMSKELNAPVLLLSQLNDDGKIRESRAPGQHADGMWKLRHKPDEDGEETSEACAVDLLIEKQRNGPRNVSVHLTFFPEFTRFESAAKVSDADVPGYRPTHPD